LGFTLPWLYPEFYLIGELFVIFLQIVLSVGGSITILGAILYIKNVSSSNILILIGSLVGGLNIISIWGWRKIYDEQKESKKTQKLEIT